MSGWALRSTSDLVAEAKPEATVLAAGVITSVPQIKGIDGMAVRGRLRKS